MSGQSSVGGRGVYEAGDQRVPPDSEKPENQRKPYEEGKENSHLANDSKDERSISNRLAAAESVNDSTSGKIKSKETKAAEIDPTLPAKLHGNEPSKGAKIDKELEEEDAELMKKKEKTSKKGITGAKP